MKIFMEVGAKWKKRKKKNWLRVLELEVIQAPF